MSGPGRRDLPGAGVVAFVLATAVFIGIICGWDPDGTQTAAWVGLSVIGLVCSIALMHKGTDLLRPSRLSIPSFFYIGYIAMIYAPAFVVFTERTDQYRYLYLVSVESVMLTVPLGILLANRVFRYSRAENERYFASPLQEASVGPYMFHVAAALVAAACLLTAVYFAQLDFESLPIVYMFRHPGDVDKLTELREEAFKMMDPRWNTAESSVLFYGYLFLRTLLFPFLILVTFGYVLVSRQARWRALFVLTLTLGGFYAAASIARAPLAAIFMRLAFFYYLAKGGRISRRAAVTLVVLMLAFPILVTGLAYGATGFVDAVERVGRRFLYTPAEDLYVYFEIFPDRVDYQYGGTLVKPILKLLNLPYFYIENYVYRYQFPNGITTGHANAAFVSNLHADFGLAGTLVGGLLTGLLMQAVQIYLARQRKSVLNVSVYAFMMYAFWVLNFGSITSVLGTNGVVFVLLMPFAMRALVGVIRRLGPASIRLRLQADPGTSA
jgi:hypothetical protein